MTILQPRPSRTELAYERAEGDSEPSTPLVPVYYRGESYREALIDAGILAPRPLEAPGPSRQAPGVDLLPCLPLAGPYRPVARAEQPETWWEPER
jgi:hypothetical protein